MKRHTYTATDEYSLHEKRIQDGPKEPSGCSTEGLWNKSPRQKPCLLAQWLHLCHGLTVLLAYGLSVCAFLGCGRNTSTTGGISPQKMADALHAVIESDRTVYTQKVVNRLVTEDEFLTVSEHWKEDKSLPLPSQMLRMGAEMAAGKDAGFTYSLLSMWPVNKQNSPKTEVEKTGLKYIADNPGKNYYAEEKLGGQRYFTAVYADIAVATACIDCHNSHQDSPRSDFQEGDVMGGVVVRVRLD